eukprot:TRINITY_DN12531_c0_g1_i4.p1 TRINITY_DN12531_c0_g1~~TRINITY_DN12531_c0_g1_i4.p1  ORF type:complete len:323 (+),score=101.41 TRINITY_DN12531_c0_g1_i4:213-1181(+)
MIQTYLCEDCAHPLNLEAKLHKQILKQSSEGQWPPELFDAAYQSTITLLRTHSYPLFINSPEYKAAMEERQNHLRGALSEHLEDFKGFLPKEERKSLYFWLEVSQMRRMQKELSELEVMEMMEGIKESYLDPCGVCLPQVMVDGLLQCQQFEDQLWGQTENYVFDYLVACYAGNYMDHEQQRKSKNKRTKLLVHPKEPPLQAIPIPITKVPASSLKDSFMEYYSQYFTKHFTSTSRFIDHPIQLTFCNTPRQVFEVIFCNSPLMITVEEEARIVSTVESVPGIREVFGCWYRKNEEWMIVPPARITWEQSCKLTMELYYIVL